MDDGVPLIRDLLACVLAWPGASDEARRLASVMWHDAADPGRPGLAGLMGRLSAELRRCRYARDAQLARAVGRLRAEIVAREAGQPPPWDASAHEQFTARTRTAARAAGLGL